MEKWRDIPGFEGFYQASTLGRIRSVERMVGAKNGSLRLNRSRILSAAPTPKYDLVTLSVDGKNKTAGVHRLVCAAFHGPPPPGVMHAAHRDGDRRNNIPSNLQWSTPKENCADRQRHGTWVHGERVNTAKLTEGEVRLIRARAASGDNRRDLAAEFGVHVSSVHQIVRGVIWKHILPNG